MRTLHVEYAERGKEYGILFILSLLCEYSHLEYVRIHVIYRVNQAEYIIYILVVAPQEYVNIYSTHRVRTSASSSCDEASASRNQIIYMYIYIYIYIYVCVCTRVSL